MKFRTQWNQTQRVLALVLAMLLTIIMPLSTAEEFSIEGEAPLEEKSSELQQLDFDTTVKGKGQTDGEDILELDLSRAESEASVEADAGLPLTDETSNGQNHPLVGKWKMVESVNKKGKINRFSITVYSVAKGGKVKLDWGANKNQTGKWDEKRQTLTVFKNRRYLLKDGVLGGGTGVYSGIALKTDDKRLKDSGELVGTWEMTERRKTSKKNDVITYKVKVLSVNGSKVRVSWGSSGEINGTWNSKTKTLKVFKDQVYVFRWGMLGGGNKKYSGVAIRKNDLIEDHPLLGEWKMVESRNKKGDVHSFNIVVRSVDSDGKVKLDWGANKNQTGKWDEKRKTLTVFKDRRYLLKDGVLGGGTGVYSGIALKTDDDRLDDNADLVGTWEMTERRKISGVVNDVITYEVSIISVNGSKVCVSWGDSGVIDGTWNSKTKTLKVFTDQVYMFRWGLLAGGNKNYSGVAFRTGDISGQKISSSIFPDAKFRKWVSENVDSNGDGILTDYERDSVSNMDISNLKIANLKGIELFENLTELDCSANKLKKLNLSKNSNLLWLNCSYNQLSSLDMSKNGQLTFLSCLKNKLKKLDMSNNTRLVFLDCSDNSLTKLTFGNNPLLETLWAEHNKIKNIDIGNCPELLNAVNIVSPQVYGDVAWWIENKDGDERIYITIDARTRLTSDSDIIYDYSPEISFSICHESEMVLDDGNIVGNAIMDPSAGNGDIYTLTVESNFAWAVSASDSTWIDLSKDNGSAGQEDLVLTLKKIEDGCNYSSELYFNVNGSVYTLTVELHKPDAKLNFTVRHKSETILDEESTAGTATMDPTAGNGAYYTLTINSNYAWTVEASDTSWFELSKTEGAVGQEDLVLTLQNIEDGYNYSSELYFNVNGSVHTLTVELHKPEAELRFTVWHGSEQILSDGSTSGTATMDPTAGNGAKYTLTINSNYPWTVKEGDTSWVANASDQSWFAMSKTSGSVGQEDLELTLRNIEDGRNHKSTLVFTVNGSTYKVTLKLNKPKPATNFSILHVSETILGAGSTTGTATMDPTAGNGAKYTLTVNSNYAWTVSASKTTWFTMSKNKGSAGKEDLVLTLKNIKDSTNYSADLIFAVNGSPYKVTVELHKPDAKLNFTVRHVSETILDAGSTTGTATMDPTAGNGAKYTLTINSNYAWTVSASQTSWFTMNKTSGDVGEESLVLTLKDIQDGKNYSSTLTFKANGSTFKVTVKLNKPKLTSLTIKHGSETLLGNGKTSGTAVMDSTASKGAKYTLSIDSSHAWTVSAGDTSWFTMSKSSGSAGKGNLVLTLKNIQDGKNYSSTLTFKVNGSTYKLTVKLSKPDLVIGKPEYVGIDTCDITPKLIKSTEQEGAIHDQTGYPLDAGKTYAFNYKTGKNVLRVTYSVSYQDSNGNWQTYGSLRDTHHLTNWNIEQSGGFNVKLPSDMPGGVYLLRIWAKNLDADQGGDYLCVKAKIWVKGGNVMPSTWLRGRFEYLKTMLPTGKYWNTASGYKTITLTGGKCDYITTISNNKCDNSSNCGAFRLNKGNGSKMSAQCFGFAEMLGYYLTYDIIGDARPYHKWKKIGEYSTGPNDPGQTDVVKKDIINNLIPGDILCYWVKSWQGHKVMITKIEDDVVYFVEGNYDGYCGIKWDSKMTKQSLLNKKIYFVLKYPGN